MFYLSWQLSLVTFTVVPAVVVISHYYGAYLRKVSKVRATWGCVEPDQNLHPRVCSLDFFDSGVVDLEMQVI